MSDYEKPVTPEFWVDTSEWDHSFMAEKEKSVSEEFEKVLYAISYDGTPRAFRWNNGKLQIADLPELELVWHDLP